MGKSSGAGDVPKKKGGTLKKLPQGKTAKTQPKCIVAFCVSHGLSYTLVPGSNHTQVIVLVPHSAAPQARSESPRLSSTPLTRFWVVLGAANPEHIGVWGAASRSDWHALRAGIKPSRGTRAFGGRESAVMHWRANGGEDDPEHPAVGKFFVWPRDGPEQ
jgi:hypothetical protein